VIAPKDAVMPAHSIKTVADFTRQSRNHPV
jgi:hypothetical protein